MLLFEKKTRVELNWIEFKSHLAFGSSVLIFDVFVVLINQSTEIFLAVKLGWLVDY